MIALPPLMETVRMNAPKNALPTPRKQTAARAKDRGANDRRADRDPPRAVRPLDMRYCSQYRQAIELIGRRWTGAIVRVLIGGPHRFNELLAAIPSLSDRLLSERLRELETRGLVLRHVLAGPPVKVEYELTDAGKDLEKVVDAISLWARKWVSPTPPA
jgi:DNA-binding HxlR family transcriptional regulator